MIIKTYNAEEYIVYSLALCGACEKSVLKKMTPSPQYASKLITKLKKNKVIKETRVGHTTFVQLSIKGQNIISQIPRLSLNNEIVSPKHGVKTEGAQIRAKAFSMQVAELIKVGGSINGIKLIYEKVPSRTPKTTWLLMEPPEVGKEIPTPIESTYIIYETQREIEEWKTPGDPEEKDLLYMPAQILKKNHEHPLHVNPAKVSGCIFGKGALYSLYTILPPGKGPINFSVTHESAFRDHIERIYETKFGSEALLELREKNFSSSAILLFEDLAAFENFINGKFGLGYKKLVSIYEHIYPVISESWATVQVEDLVKKNYSKNRLNKMYTVEEIRERDALQLTSYCDGIIEGRLSTNLMDADFCSLKRLEDNLITRQAVHAFCRPEMYDIFYNYLSDKGDVLIDTLT